MLGAGTVLPSIARPPALEELAAIDLETVRILLQSDSVIDWHRLAFSGHEEVDRFLRLNEFDPDAEDELARLEGIREAAVEYLTRVFGMAIPDDVAGEVAARDLFLMASRQGPHQRWACVVLKVMHIIHHINGRAALTKVSVSDDYIFREVELKVLRVVEALRAAGAPVAEFEWSRKPRDSQITKLLAKRSTLAANIYDKLRFRIIVPHRDHLLPTLATLGRQLIPFNYVVPGESINQLVDLEQETMRSGRLRDLMRDLRRHHNEHRSSERMLNEFSGREYRIINFVADLPLRLERLLPPHELTADLSHVVFVLTEFQLADKATALQNEQGECSHEAYKQRQLDRVRARLFRGEDDPLPPG